MYQVFVVSVLFLCLTACQSPNSDSEGASDVKQQKSRPNILLIVADDLGYGDVGAYGQQHIQTPNLDALASQGVMFTQHYAGATVCGPSRASLLTGRDPGHSPIRGNPKWTQSGNAVELSADTPTIATMLKSAGYNTALIGKWGMADGKAFNLNAMPSHNGFDYFYGYKTHLAAHHYYWHELYRNDEPVLLKGNDYLSNSGQYTHDLFTRDALGYLQQQSQQKPFFLMLSYTIPHMAITVPDDAKQPYLELNWPKRPLPTDGHYKHDSEGNVSYAGMVSRMDRDIGQLIAQLKQQGLADNTVVIFTSDNGHEYDNGFFNSNGDFRGKKRDLYEGGIRIPMIAHWPELSRYQQKPRVSQHISAFWDYMPTFCEIAGVVKCPVSEGISFLPTLINQGRQDSHDSLYWEFNENQGPIQALRRGDYKLVQYYQRPLELYHLAKDPQEKYNIASSHPDLVSQLQQRLKTARTYHPEFQLKPLPNPWSKKNNK